MTHSNHIGDYSVNTLVTDFYHHPGDNLQMKESRTYLARVLADRDMTQADLCRLTAMSKQQIGRFVNGERIPRPDKAIRIAAALDLPDWRVLISDTAGQISTTVEHRIVVGQRPPLLPEVFDDLDEMALLEVWRSLSFIKKAALFAHLGLDEMPSLRKLA